MSNLRVMQVFDQDIGISLKDRANAIFSGLDVSRTTIKDYSYRIGLFMDFVKEGGLQSDTFLEYKRFLAFKSEYSVSTKNKYLISARVFLNELYRRAILPFDITKNVKGFTQSRKHKRTGLTEDEINLVAGYLRGLPNTPYNERLRAIVSLLTYQGLRLVEITRLDVNDLDLAHGIALIHGKGQDDKEPIYLHPETVRALQGYLRANRLGSGALFIGLRGNHGKGRISVRGIQKVIIGLLKGLGLDKSCHGFRHYFTTKLIKAYSSDLVTVQKFTRHKSLDMLLVYNDNLSLEADLPRYFETFENVAFQGQYFS